jgi:hypothetical protein
VSYDAVLWALHAVLDIKADDNTGALENIFIFMLDHVRVGFKIFHPAVFSGMQIDDPFALVKDGLVLLMLVNVPVMLIISRNHGILNHLRNNVSGGMKSRRS